MPDPRWLDNDRFKREHGFPKSRREISTKDLKDKYTIIRKLVPEGTGGLNEGINFVRENETGRRFVQKQIDPTNNILLREMLLLQVLDHPNVIKYYDGFIDKCAWNHHTASFYMEFCNLKSAQDLLDKYYRRNANKPDERRVYIPEILIWHIFRSLAYALQYLHHGIKIGDARDPKDLDNIVRAHDYCWKVWPMIMHRDIKPENIFFRKTQPVFGSTVQKQKLLRVIPRRKRTYRVYPQMPKVVLGDFVSYRSIVTPEVLTASSL